MTRVGPGTKFAAFLAVFRTPEAFLQHSATQHRPYVVLKIATSLDGRVACEDKTSQWITQARCREQSGTKCNTKLSEKHWIV